MSEMHERELWSVAVFRLRESANRIFSLATRVRAPEIRARLLRIYEQLRAEEAKLATLADAAELAAERGRYPQGSSANMTIVPIAPAVGANDQTELSDD